MVHRSRTDKRQYSDRHQPPQQRATNFKKENEKRKIFRFYLKKVLTSLPVWYNIQILMSDDQKNNDWKERELGALWVKKSLTGTQYMTGHIELKDASGKVQLVVFKNKHKYNEDGTVANDKAPDFRVFKSEEREQQKDSGQEASKETVSASASTDEDALF